MAVSADHDTFFDLRQYPAPAISARYGDPDRKLFAASIAMMEVQARRLHFATPTASSLRLDRAHNSRRFLFVGDRLSLNLPLMGQVKRVLILPTSFSISLPPRRRRHWCYWKATNRLTLIFSANCQRTLQLNFGRDARTRTEVALLPKQVGWPLPYVPQKPKAPNPFGPGLWKIT